MYCLLISTLKWKLVYEGVPITIYVDSENSISGYDFWNTNERTNAITRFFNIVTGSISAEVFDFPQP